jgi:hypothetical protein
VNAPRSNRQKSPTKPPRPQSERARRVPFEHRVSIRIEHPGASVVSFEVQARDLSSSGLRVQHMNYIYPNSPATISFVRGKKVLVAAAGHVVRCDYIGNRQHDVGISFDRPLDASELVLLTPATPPQR